MFPWSLSYGFYFRLLVVGCSQSTPIFEYFTETVVVSFSQSISYLAPMSLQRTPASGAFGGSFFPIPQANAGITDRFVNLKVSTDFKRYFLVASPFYFNEVTCDFGTVWCDDLSDAGHKNYLRTSHIGSTRGVATTFTKILKSRIILYKTLWSLLSNMVVTSPYVLHSTSNIWTHNYYWFRKINLSSHPDFPRSSSPGDLQYVVLKWPTLEIVGSIARHNLQFVTYRLPLPDQHVYG